MHRPFASWIVEEWKGSALFNEPLSRHTSWRIGGPCDLMLFPQGQEDLREFIHGAVRWGEPLFLMGRGTNLLVRDGGLRGTVINLSRGLKEMVFQGDRVRAGAGVGLWMLALRAAQQGLSGLEFTAGIPGTVGGGVKGNAGAFGSSMDRVLEGIEIFDGQGTNHRISRSDLVFSYRSCQLPREAVIAGAEFKLFREDPDRVRQRIEELQQERRRTQPLGVLTAGSVFKNPSGGYAARIIESLGLKGTIVGGARISQVHANFIENMGGASAADVIILIEMIQKRVKRELGLELELEIQVVGQD